MRFNKLNFLLTIFIGFVILSHSTTSQNLTTNKALTEDISDNLDLEAVASVFGESEDLENFEKRLNDPDTQISNLDLNNDGKIDYLRVMETADENKHTISIQSIAGINQYQEVATFVIEKDTKGVIQVQVIGDLNMYGSNYYIAPIYSVQPVFFKFFWVTTYQPWHSPWYWEYHPLYFHPWSPYAAHKYRTKVQVHINMHNSYHRTNASINNNHQVRNTNTNAYFQNNPNKTFDKRNPGISNRNELNNKRNLTSNKKNNKSFGNQVNQSNKYKKESPVTNSSTRAPKNQRAKPSTLPSNNSYSQTSQSRPSHLYSRQAPSRFSIARTRH